MKKKQQLLHAVGGGVLALAAAGASAQSAGTWMVGGGATRIAPNTESGTLSPPSPPQTQVEIGADTRPTLFLTYMVTDHFSLEVPVGLGFKHEIHGAGSIAGVGRIGTTRVLPVSVFAQYRFLEPTARVRPYVMLGLTYAYFYDEQGSATLNALNPLNPAGGTQLDIASRWGVAPGLGVTAMVTDRWFVDLQYARSFLKTTTTLTSGQRISTKLNPDVWKVGVGYRF